MGRKTLKTLMDLLSGCEGWRKEMERWEIVCIDSGYSSQVEKEIRVRLRNFSFESATEVEMDVTSVMEFRVEFEGQSPIPSWYAFAVGQSVLGLELLKCPRVSLLVWGEEEVR